MSIRWRLNLAVGALILVFLGAAGFALYSVRRSSEYANAYSRMRQVSQLTSDLRTAIHQQVAIISGLLSPPPDHEPASFSRLWSEDIEIQIHHAQSDRERELWKSAKESLGELDRRPVDASASMKLNDVVRKSESTLRQLRDLYDVAEFASIRRVATTSLSALVAVGVACLLTVFLFLIYLIMIRHWLVKPIEILQHSTDRITDPNSDCRVPLSTKDELGQLARRIEMMIERLHKHQLELSEARELSAIGELCTNVAHGLRNPLAAMRATAQLGQRRMGDQPNTIVLLREIMLQIDRMDDRITKLFAFSRPSELRFQQTTFRELAKAVQAEVGQQVTQRGMTLLIEDRCESRTVAVDRDAMSSALSELVLNAVHHSQAGSEITLRAGILNDANDGPIMRICVIDLGAGMSAATKDKAFSLFFTSRPDGTGMGLSMTRRMIERHRGEIRIDSQPGQGTTVTIDLPAVEPANFRMGSNDLAA